MTTEAKSDDYYAAEFQAAIDLYNRVMIQDQDNGQDVEKLNRAFLKAVHANRKVRDTIITSWMWTMKAKGVTSDTVFTRQSAPSSEYIQ